MLIFRTELPKSHYDRFETLLDSLGFYIMKIKEHEGYIEYYYSRDDTVYYYPERNVDKIHDFLKEMQQETFKEKLRELVGEDKEFYIY